MAHHIMSERELRTLILRDIVSHLSILAGASVGFNASNSIAPCINIIGPGYRVHINCLEAIYMMFRVDGTEGKRLKVEYADPHYLEHITSFIHRSILNEIG